MPARAVKLPPISDIESSIAEQCEDRLSVFIREGWAYVDPVPYVHGRHIEVMGEYLEALIAGEISKLLINIPPGHQKSLTVSVFLHPWTWTRRPEKRFMFTSYRGDLALRDADRARALIRSAWYQQRWGQKIGGLREQSFEMRQGQDQKTRYSNDKGGYRFSTAVSGIMGEGGDFIGLDDPHNVEQAESDTVRDETVRRIRLALPTRIRSKDGGVVVMMQRLHSKDYSGHVLTEEKGWVHLCLPARFESEHPHRCRPRRIARGRTLPGDWRTNDGELLWPGLFPEARIADIETSLGSYGSAGQLQQRPVPREGGMFKRAWFEIVRAVPAGGVQCRGWDLAATAANENPKAAWTCGVLLRVVKGIWYVCDVKRERLTPAGVEKLMKNTAIQDGHFTWQDFPQDPGQAGKAQAQNLAKLLVGFRVKYSPESGSKETRAEGFAAQAEAGNVKILAGPWHGVYLDELALFPGGEFKDQADASSRAFHRLLAAPAGIKVGRTIGSY